MNSQPFLSADTTTGPLSSADMFNLLQQGKTLGEITVQTGPSRLIISKLLNIYHISYRSFVNERQHAKYKKTFSKCYDLAVKLNRIPNNTETISIKGISVFRSRVNKKLLKLGFRYSEKHHWTDELPEYSFEKTLDHQLPAGHNADIIADKKEVVMLLGQIARDLGSTLSNNEIVEKVSQNLLTPCFTLPPFFSQEKMKAYNYYKLKKKKNNEKLLLRLISISNQLGYSPGKNDLCKINKTFYPKLFHAFGGLRPALKQAGLEPRPKNILNSKRREKILSKLKSISNRLGHSPRKKDIRKIDKSFYQKLYRSFGGLQNALKTAGLPVTRNYGHNNAISGR